MIAYLGYQTLKSQIPNEIKILAGREEKFDFSIPIMACISNNRDTSFHLNSETIHSNKISIDLNRPFTLESDQKGSYEIDLSLFGFIHLKEVKLDVIDQLELIPSGDPIGIYVKTDGVMVLGTSIITSMDGMNYEPALNKLKSGDYITEISGKCIHSKGELIDEIQKCDGKPIVLKVRRGKERLNVSIEPVETAIGEYKIGTWIRDDTQGIGTLTFITNNRQFGALGHGITDIDTSLLMEVSSGDVYTAEIMSIVKGKNGCPGELIGLINQSDRCRVGDIERNTNQGIFGDIGVNSRMFSKRDGLPIGLKQDVRLGDATIRCNVEGKVKDYTISIEKIDRTNLQLSKGLVIKITDEHLLELTGGIVQGMSGSPIIQDGKLIGAVTHVFIQDSTKGYGTFIENMIRNLD